MVGEELHPGGDSRSRGVWTSLPCVLVVLAWGASILAGEPDARRLALCLTLSAALLLWHVWWITLHPAWPEHAVVPMTVYFIGLLAGSWQLTMLGEPFAVVLAGCYAMAFVALPGPWAYGGAALTGLAFVLSGADAPPDMSYIVMICGFTVLAGVIGWAIRRAETEERRRRQAHEELLVRTEELRRSNEAKDALQARLETAAREAGITDERTRIAREFHDTLAQGLAGITSQLEHAEALIDDHRPAHRQIGIALELARTSLREARRSVLALRPGPLATGTLAAVLRETVRSWEERHGIPVRCEVAETAEPDDADLKAALLRFTEEALANVARHARADHVSVTMSSIGDDVVIDVIDDGVGFDVETSSAAGKNGGWGLTGARERLAQVGAELVIDTGPGRGTAVTAIAPGRRARPRD